MSLVRSTEISFYQHHLLPAKKVLDFGCGDGFFLNTLKKFHPTGFKNSQIIGLDIKNNSRTSQIPKRLYKRVDLYNGNKIPYAQNTFDAVIANCVFEHLPNLTTILKQLQRILKPQGKLYATVMTNRWEDYLRLPGPFWQKVQVHHQLFSAAGWRKQFCDCGFKIITLKGYLNKPQSQLVELSHFTSLPYLVSYLFFRRWDLPGKLYTKFVNQNRLTALFSQKVPVNQAAGLFVVLKKQ